MDGALQLHHDLRCGETRPHRHRHGVAGLELSSLVINGSLALICLIWIVPTLGLFISSFRPRDLIATSGWWSVFPHYTALNLNGTYFALWLAHTGFGLVLAIYPLYNYISQLPRETLEAAFSVKG